MATGSGRKNENKNFEMEKGQHFVLKANEKASFVQFLWNSETKEFLGRTFLRWVKIVCFYIVFYSALAGFFLLMLFAFLLTIRVDRPVWTCYDGIIGSSPGVAFRPSNQYMESSLIWFRSGEYSGNWHGYVEQLEQYLEPYKDEFYASQYNFVDCENLENGGLGYGEMCKINLEQLFQGDCNSENGYGYRDGTPCILIKLNKVYDWLPEPYEHIDDMPDDIPQTIKDAFQRNIDDGNPDLNFRVWIECQGESPADKENIGPIRYFPERGVSANHYPYANQPGYLSPVIFVQLQSPHRGGLISIECRAWARNIEHDTMNRRGLGIFQILID